MRVREIVSEMTSAGAIATVAMPMGKVQRRNPSIYGEQPKKKKKKGK